MYDTDSSHALIADPVLADVVYFVHDIEMLICEADAVYAADSWTVMSIVTSLAHKGHLCLAREIERATSCTHMKRLRRRMAPRLCERDAGSHDKCHQKPGTQKCLSSFTCMPGQRTDA